MEGGWETCRNKCLFLWSGGAQGVSSILREVLGSSCHAAHTTHPAHDLINAALRPQSHVLVSLHMNNNDLLGRVM